MTFPVVQRQWDAVSHFKSQILQKARQYLKVTDQSEQVDNNFFSIYKMSNIFTYLLTTLMILLI